MEAYYYNRISSMCFDKILAGGRTPFKSKGFVTQFTKPFVAVTASHGLQICIK